MNRSIVSVVMSVAVMLCGCGPQTTSHDIVIHLKKPSTVAVNSIPACDASQLSAHGVPHGGSTPLNVDVAITNTSSSACDLIGLPNAMQLAVQLVRSDGSVVRTKVISVPTTLVLIFTLLKPYSANEAHLSVNWGNWCKAYPGRVLARITFPYNKGVLTGSFNSLDGQVYVPACLTPGVPSTLQVLQ
jgi:hypothetical protein